MSEEQLIKTPCAFGENGNFMLERELGRGGMGGVYMGRDKMLDRPVAVKVMLREYGSDAEFVEKFKREAQAAARLIHPNIAQIYSYGIADGMPYIAMELVAGGALDQLMAHSGAKIDVPRVMKICEQVAQALRCAADQGLVHGDVKPENILLDANGNAKLVDFGLAAMQKDTNEIWGTPYYIAPEKVKKEPVDYRADMYSLGGTIYHALTGVAPFEGEDAAAVVRKRFEGAPKKPSEVRPGLSPQIDFLVMKMLAMNPEDRYPSFEALLEDYKKVLTTGLSSTQSISPAQAAAAGAAAAGGTGRIATGAGGKKLTIKPRRKLTVSRPAADGEDDVPELDSGVAARHRPDYDDDEPQGNVGGKVAMVIGGVIAGIVVVLGLVWFAWSHNIAKNRAKEEAALAAEYRKIDVSLKDVSQKLPEFQTKVDKLKDKIGEDCAKLQKRMQDACAGMCPQEILQTMRPPKTKVLLDAERALSGAAEGAAGAAQAAPAAAVGQMAAAMGQMAAAMGAPANDAAMAKMMEEMGKMFAALSTAAETGDVTELMNAMSEEDYRKMVTEAAKAGFKFRPPKDDDEADAASPKGMEYRKEQLKWIVAQAVKAESAVKTGAAGGAAPAQPEEAGSPDAVFPPVLDAVSKIREFWTKTYAAQAGALKLTMQIRELQADVESAMAPYERTGEILNAKSKVANDIVGRFNELQKSNEFSELQKMESLLENSGKKALSRIQGRIRDENRRLQMIKQEKDAKEEAERREKEAAEKRAEFVKNGLEEIHTKFEVICSNGNLRQLDWKGAKRQLQALKDSLVDEDGKLPAELEIEVDKEIRKVDMMESVQTILKRNIKGFVFQRFTKDKHLKGMEVLDVDDKQLTVRKKGATTGQKTIPWQSFYRDYHANLSEICERFIRKGNLNGTPKLKLREQADAMFGVALTMQLVFADDATASNYGESMAKDALKRFPNYLEYAKEVFPNINFSDVEKEAAENQL